MLIVFGGLPGTGKTTISRAVARALAATHLRVDVIEQAIRDSGVLAGPVGASGYAVAQALALANSATGRSSWPIASTRSRPAARDGGRWPPGQRCG